MILQSKYEKLAEYLRELDVDKVTMTFDEIEEILEEPLPDTAMTRPWWANSATNNHALNGWMDAGWETANVNMDQGVLDFIKVGPTNQESAPLMSPSSPYPRRERYSRARSTRSELDEIVQRAGSVENVRRYMVVIERYLFGEITEMELGRELRRLYHRR